MFLWSTGLKKTFDGGRPPKKPTPPVEKRSTRENRGVHIMKKTTNDPATNYITSIGQERLGN
jgi:hypothetical protein